MTPTRPTKARAATAAALAALAVTLAGCQTSADKAGGSHGGETIVLTLEQSDPDYGGAQFAAAVNERSGGSIRIMVSPTWHRDRVDFERGVVEDVRAGKSDLGVVGVRALDTLGVTSFQALIAPFLVDSLEFERRVLESPLAARMLAGVGRGGVVGIAALPGPLRRPFGYTRPLVRRRDYVGFRIGVHPGRVEGATLRSLGATTRDYLNLSGASREGAILNFGGIAASTAYRGKTLAANVVFWPRAETVVMNRQAFAALRPAQRQILRDAGRRAVAPRLAEVRRLEDAALRTICDRRLAELVSVPAHDVAALVAAVRPVYAQLDRNAQTRELIGEIRKLQTRVGTVGVEKAQCPEPEATGLSALAGSWTSSATRGELLAQGASAAEASTYAGAGRLELKDGRWTFRGERTTVTGTYRIERDEITLTMRTCTANPCSPGAATDYAWSVYRDRLFLRPGSDLPVWPRLVAGPFTRVR